MRYVLLLAILLIGASIAYGPEPRDEYYAVIFAYNNPTGRIKPTQTHVFGTYVHTRNKRIIEQVDISWGPVRGGINLIRGAVEGRNKPLADTIQDCQGKAYKHWVLRTNEAFFKAAKTQRDSLTMYKVLDTYTRPNAVNCIHACSDIAGFLTTGTITGIPAGQMVNDFYVKTGKGEPQKDSWVVGTLMEANQCDLP